MSEKLKKQLIQLSHELGREERALAILGEGNTSVKLENGNFLVKASGSCLGTLSDDGITECNVSNILDLFNQLELSDLEVDKALLDSRVVAESKKPSVEATFHGYLLSLPGVKFVGHTHPIHVNKLLCSGNGRDFAERRIFPDQIVCCGAESVFVPTAARHRAVAPFFPLRPTRTDFKIRALWKLSIRSAIPRLHPRTRNFVPVPHVTSQAPQSSQANHAHEQIDIPNFLFFVFIKVVRANYLLKIHFCFIDKKMDPSNVLIATWYLATITK